MGEKALAMDAQLESYSWSDHRWAVILAGGDGRRLLPLTRAIAGDERPKQFCSILGPETLLDQTRRRVGRTVDPKKTHLVLTRTHEPFYSSQLAGIHWSCLSVQPCNRGTTPAIVYSLMRIRELDPEAVVGFFPSDHHFEDEQALRTHVECAFETAETQFPGVVLLGIIPHSPEVEYGWIEPGARLALAGSVFRVRRFWEKPSFTHASVLMQRSCLWNSFIMVGRVESFLGLIQYRLPDLMYAFESIRPAFFTGAEREALADLYSGIPAINFSEIVLSACPRELAVLPAGNLGWSDLGNTARVLSVLQREGFRLVKPAGSAGKQRVSEHIPSASSGIAVDW